MDEQSVVYTVCVFVLSRGRRLFGLLEEEVLCGSWDHRPTDLVDHNCHQGSQPAS